MNDRYPDPKKEASDADSQKGQPKGKKGAEPKKPAPAGGKDDKKKAEPIEATAEPEKEEEARSPSMSDNDSVIDDAEVDDFTNKLQYMRGAPLKEELKKILLEKSRGKPGAVPEDPDFLDNLAATKTAYQSDALLREYEQKKRTCLQINDTFNI